MGSNNLIRTFELLSVNLYDFIKMKGNRTETVTLLYHRWATFNSAVSTKLQCAVTKNSGCSLYSMSPTNPSGTQ